MIEIFWVILFSILKSLWTFEAKSFLFCFGCGHKNMRVLFGNTLEIHMRVLFGNTIILNIEVFLNFPLLE